MNIELKTDIIPYKSTITFDETYDLLDLIDPVVPWTMLTGTISVVPKINICKHMASHIQSVCYQTAKVIN